MFKFQSKGAKQGYLLYLLSICINPFGNHTKFYIIGTVKKLGYVDGYVHLVKPCIILSNLSIRYYDYYPYEYHINHDIIVNYTRQLSRLGQLYRGDRIQFSGQFKNHRSETKDIVVIVNTTNARFADRKSRNRKLIPDPKSYSSALIGYVFQKHGVNKTTYQNDKVSEYYKNCYKMKYHQWRLLLKRKRLLINRRERISSVIDNKQKANKKIINTFFKKLILYLNANHEQKHLSFITVKWLIAYNLWRCWRQETFFSDYPKYVMHFDMKYIDGNYNLIGINDDIAGLIEYLLSIYKHFKLGITFNSIKKSIKTVFNPKLIPITLHRKNRKMQQKTLINIWHYNHYIFFNSPYNYTLFKEF